MRERVQRWGFATNTSYFIKLNVDSEMKFCKRYVYKYQNLVEKSEKGM